MRVKDCPLKGLKLIETDVFRDERGFFAERYNAEKFSALGLSALFVQDNHSRSAAGVLRGLHYQHTPAQDKLVGVLRGSIWDVAVDIRPESSTFGQHFGVELKAEIGQFLWIPAGFAHGFCVLGDEAADVLYKVTALYNPKGEGGIRYDDADLHIDWPVREPLISPRDTQLASWKDYCAQPPLWL